MEYYSKYLNYIDAQAKKAKINYVINKILEYIYENNENIEEKTKNYIIIKKNEFINKILTNNVGETDVFFFLEEIKSIIIGNKLKKHLKESINSLQSIIDKRKTSSFPISAIRESHLSAFNKILKEYDRVLDEDQVLKFIEEIKLLRENIKSDLDTRDELNYKLKQSIESLQSIIIERRNNSSLFKSSIQDSFLKKFDSLMEKINEKLYKEDITSYMIEIESLKKEIESDLFKRDKKIKQNITNIFLGMIAIVVIIVFWNIFKWILIAIVIFGILALLSD